MSSVSQILPFIEQHPSLFRQSADWFKINWPIVQAFEQTALAIIGKGREHYSARTIVEVLRHHSVLNDTSTAFKINDHAAPDLARAFVVMHPQHLDMWEYRRASKAEFSCAIKAWAL